MKAVFQLALTLALCVSATLVAQVPRPATTSPSSISLPGQGDPTDPANDQFLNPVNDIVERKMVNERRILAYEDVREADLMWSKRIFRVLDVREKINMPFAYPDRPLITILLEAADSNKIRLYDPIDDGFKVPLTDADRGALAGGIDTVEVIDADFNITYEPVARELNPADIQRYRLQEIWFFDKESSTMQVRILGIAPLKNEFDELGNLLFELPMFWVYYPGARQMLANEQAYAAGNDAANRSWEDVFEARYFNSYIIKESNVLDRRIDGYLTSGRERLLEAERIKHEIFNYEQDLWSY